MMPNAVLLAIKIGIDPTLVEVAGVEITWHGIFTALGVIVGVTVAAAFARRAGYSEDAIYNVALAAVVGGIIGARGLYVLENWSQFEDDLGEIVAINTGGISIYGALIGGTIGGWAYAYLARVENLWLGADIAAMGGILGMAVGRIGDVINGEHYAKGTDLPWGVQYTDPNSPSFLFFGGPNAVQHPAVGYELLGDVAIFGVLLLIYTRLGKPGLTFLAYVFLYGALRVAVSFMRLDDVVLLGLRTAQLIGIAAMVASLPAMVYFLRTSPEEEEEGEEPAAGEERLMIAQEGIGEEPTQGA